MLLYQVLAVYLHIFTWITVLYPPGANNGHHTVQVAGSVPGQDSDDDVPPSWNVRTGSQPVDTGGNRWSQASDDSAPGGGSYNLQ